MANILYRGTIAPTQPPAVAGGSVAKNSPLTNDEGDWNYKALNDDIQTRATSANPSFTGITSFEYDLRSVLAKYNKYVAGLSGSIAACKIGEYLPNADNSNATLIVEVVGRTVDHLAYAKAKVMFRTSTLPTTTITITNEKYRNDTTDLTIEAYVDNSTGKLVLFANVAGTLTNISFNVEVYERNADNLFAINKTYVAKNTTGLTQITETVGTTTIGGLVAYSISGNGSGLTYLNATNITSGTLSGARGVAAGSTSVSFVAYNGTTKAAGKFDSGTTDPNNTNRLNYDGHFYATKVYGDGSGLTNIDATTLGGIAASGYAKLASSNTFTDVQIVNKETGAIGGSQNMQLLAQGTTSAGVSLKVGAFSINFGLNAANRLVLAGGSGTSAEKIVKLNRSIPISVNTTSQVDNTYVMTASLILTLPPTPTAGDEVGAINRSGTTTCVIARNGSNIMGLAENMIVDKLNAPLTLRYIDATQGWILV